MSVTDALVVPEDVLIVPVSELPLGVRERLAADGGAFAVTRPRSRVSSKIVSVTSAELLRAFRQPRRVVDVVAEFARRHELDPRAVLTDAFPVIRDCYNARLLVPVDSPEARGIVPSLSRGDRVGRFEIVRSVQVLADTELYQGKDALGAPVAVKIAKAGGDTQAAALLAREAQILERLRGAPVPTVLDVGTLEDGGNFLVLSWCAGVSPLVPAAEARDERSSAARARLVALCRALVAGYADLHARGAVHGDVQPHNMVIDAAGRVTLLDFGLARLRGSMDGPPRSGVAYFLDPELAAAWMGDGPEAPATEASDQYALAGVLYLVVTGAHYLEFALEREAMLRQIVEQPPLPFTRRRTEPWPSLEAVFRRALSKRPEDRFPSMEGLAVALEHVEPGPPVSGAARRRPALPDDVVDRSLERLYAASPRFAEPLPAPTASVTYGAAGIAFALYRIACIRDDSTILAMADAWANRAVRESASPAAFYDSGRGITLGTVGAVSPYHTVSGVHAVRALIAQAQGDVNEATSAVEAFIAASRGPAPSVDLTLGSSGVLLVTSLLLAAMPPAWSGIRRALLAFGEDMAQRVWYHVGKSGPVGNGSELTSLGVAHGRKGVLFAMLSWLRTSGSRLPDDVSLHLDELARCAEPVGRGFGWPSPTTHEGHVAHADYPASWCNGSAGLVFLWTEAHRALGGDYLRFARGAAFNAWEAKASWPSLCCGLIGRSYALLNMFRYTGDHDWLERAIRLAERAAASTAWREVPHRETSLYKGEVALAALIADLGRPEAASMPLFEDEGWPSRG